MIPLEQTLHGYDEGHRILATSTGLDAEEERTIDLLSDLSGYLPHGSDFSHYDTGYPCGRFYVLSRTWPDRKGKRSGTVFTHSLLIPRSACVEIRSLTSLTSYFRLPSHPVDRLTYRQSLNFSPFESSQPLLSSMARRHLAALWFGQDLRPLLWTDPDTADEAARLLWSWLPPWLRADHSFCTFALQPRYLGPKLFDWLAIAKGADGLFYSLRDRTLRCDGRNLPNGTSALLEAPWVAEIAHGRTESVQALWEEAIALELPQVPAADLRIFLRYREFRTRAETNLTAAFTRVDLLRRLAPGADQAIQEKTEAMWKCLIHARAIPPTERNLIVGLDLLERDPRSFAPRLVSDVGAFLAESLEARAAEQSELALSIVRKTAGTAFTEPTRRGVYEALRKRNKDETSVEAWLGRLGPLAVALIEEDPVTASVVITAAPSEARLKIVEYLLWFSAAGDPLAVAEALRIAAENLSDLILLRALVTFIQATALLDTAEIIVLRAGAADVVILEHIVAGAGTDNLIFWLEAHTPQHRLPAVLVEAVALTLKEPREAALVLERLLPGASGVLVLAAYATHHTEWSPASLLDAHPEVITLIFQLAKEETHRLGFEQIVPFAVSLAEEDALLSAFNLEFPEQWQHASWANVVVRRLVPALVTRRLAGTISAEQLRAWLVTASSNAWLHTNSSSHLGDLFLIARGESALRALELLTEPTLDPLRCNQYIVRACLEAWGAQNVRDIVLLVPGWTTLIHTLSDPAIYAAACAITLRVAFDHPEAALAPLAEVAFASAHRESLQDAPHGWLVTKIFSLLFSDDWDHAKQLRERLARAWVDNDWEPLSLLRAAQGDEQLFADLVRSAEHRSGGKKALRRLWKAARDAPAREWSWDSMLARLPRNVRED